MNEAAARKKAEQELFAGFNERNPIRPSNEKIIEREKIDVDIGTIEDFMMTLYKQVEIQVSH
jgi:hypothetical protein